jgi:hypothetical protein
VARPTEVVCESLLRHERETAAEHCHQDAARRSTKLLLHERHVAGVRRRSAALSCGHRDVFVCQSKNEHTNQMANEHTLAKTWVLRTCCAHEEGGKVPWVQTCSQRR